MKKIFLVALLVVIIVGLYIKTKPQPTPTATPQGAQKEVVKKVSLEIKDNKLTSDSTKFEFTQGEVVDFIITSDTDGEVHFHGYDKSIDAKKDSSVTLQIILDTAGNFPFELEESKTELGTVVVNPK